jgi:hypothetical protein
MTTYNRDPYFDDFDKSKNFVKILFKPGVSVQARELTQLQTAIQEQIKSVGGFLFKNESLVTGGNSRTFSAVWIDVVATDLADYVGKTFIGNSNNNLVPAKAQVIAYKNNVTSGVSRLYFVYKNGSRFQSAEELTEDVLSPSVASVVTTDTNSNTGMAMAYTISESVFFVKDYFVVCSEQTIIISENATPSAKIGLAVTEDIITYQDDANLLDPATGSYNYAAPGADRVSISLDLIVYPFDPVADLDADFMVENTEDNFIELARYNNGALVKSVTSPNLGPLESVLARRTYDESGDYTVRSFKTKAVNNVKKDGSKLSLAIEPGKAYVKGYEFETTSTLYLDLDKARETSTINNFYGEAAFGDYFIINHPTGGTLTYNDNPEISLVTSTITPTGMSRTGTTANTATATFALQGSSPYFIPYPVGSKITISGSTPTTGATFNGTFTVTACTTTTVSWADSGVATTASVVGTITGSSIGTARVRYVSRQSSTQLKVYVYNVKFTVGSTSAVAILFNSPWTATVDATNLNKLYRGKNTQFLIPFTRSPIKSATDISYTSQILLTCTATGTSPNATIIPPTTLSVGKTYSSSNPYDYVVIKTTTDFSVVDPTTYSVSVSGGQTFTLTGTFTNGASYYVYAKIAVSTPTVKSKVKTTATVYVTNSNNRAISLGVADPYRIVSIYAKDSTDSVTPLNVTGRYSLDRGQKDSYYDFGKIVLRNGQQSANTATYTRLAVTLEYFASPQTNGYYSIDSYNTDTETTSLLVPYENIPSFTASNGAVVSLRDVIDFRAKRTAVPTFTTCTLASPISRIAVTGASVTAGVATIAFSPLTLAPYVVGQKITVEGVSTSEYNVQDAIVTECTVSSVKYKTTATASASAGGFISTPENPVAFSLSGDEFITPSSNITSDFEYYLPRTDKLIITKEKKFDLIQGVSSEIPQIPSDLSDAMTIYTIDIPAYTFSAAEVKLNYIENRRYTMRDIGKIDKRLDRLEYYTSMSLLEKQASDEVIVNNSGVDKFKNGILVDPFAGHGVGDVGSSEYSCSIDGMTRTLRPRFATSSFNFDINLTETSSTNYSKKDDLITLPYTTEVYLSNYQATNWQNLNPYAVFSWNGEIKLNPATDNWTDTTTRPDVIVNINGDKDAFTIIADDVSNPASVGVEWNDWQTNVKGVTVTPTTTKTVGVSTALQGSQAIQSTSTTTTTTLTTVSNQTALRTGIEVESSAVSTVTRDLGNKVVDTSIVPFIRSRVVDFSATKLKPATQLFASFDGVDVTTYCTQAPVIYVTTIKNATRVRKIGTGKAGDIVLLKTDRAYVKMDSDQSLFAVGDTVEWLVNNSWVTGTTITEVAGPVDNTLVTDENGDVAGYFLIPNNNDTKFRTGERPFRLADTLGIQPVTAAETKYVAQGLAMSIQKDIVATRVVTVAINPVEQAVNSTSTSVSSTSETSVVQKNVTVRCGETQSGSGATGRYVYDIDFGTDIGECGVNYDATGIPDRYTLIWNGRTVSSGFRGSVANAGNASYYNDQLNQRGYPSVTGVIDTNNPAAGKLRFTKTEIFPNKAQLIVDAPLSGTKWAWKAICPGKTDNLLPETDGGRLDVTVDVPSTTNTAYRSVIGSHPNHNRTQTPFIDTAATGVAFNFTVKINGNQNIPNGTLIVITSINRAETTTNGRWESFATGTRFLIGSGTSEFGAGILALLPGLAGKDVTFPYATTVGSTLTFTAIYNFTANAKTQGLNAAGSLRNPASTITVNAQLVSAIDGSLAAVSAADSVVHTSTYDRWDYSNCRHDPLAQTFFVSSTENPDGVFVDSVDLFFKSKDDNDTVPVTVQIRPTVNGYPSSDTVLPFATGDVLSKDIVVSEQSSTSKAATKFNFQAPVFLSPDTEYALVIMANSDKFETYTSRIGEFLLSNANVRCTKQPLSGSLFTSQNGTAWTAVQTDDLVFRINKCVFGIDVERPVVLNASIPAELKTSADYNYDTIFIDGEVLDFANTNINYSYKAAQLAGTVYAKDSSWNNYQLGSNVVMPARKTLDIQDPTTLRVQCAMRTSNRDISPVIDLNRLSTVLIKNIVNNNSRSENNETLATVTSVSASSTEVTVTTSAAHGFVAGDNVFVYANQTNEVNGLVTIASVGMTTVTNDNFTYSRFDGGGVVSATAQGGTVTRNAQALSRYITRKVTLNADFYSTDLKAFFLANIPAECSVIPYYRVTSLSDPILEDNDWIPMTLDTVGTPNSAGFAEYKYKTPYTVSSNTAALSTGELYGTFSVKLVMLSSNPVKVPQIKDLRVLALDE